MDAPRLRLALPQSDGSLLLDFEHGERRLVDAETMSVFGLTAAGLFADADAVNADGLRTADGGCAATSLLHVASLPATAIHERRGALRLAQWRGTTSGAPRFIDVMFYPFERINALRIDDVIGAGMAADGYTTEIALDGVVGDEFATSLLRDAGADWVLDALKAGADRDDGECARALLRAAWAKDIEDLVAPAPMHEAVDPATLTRASAIDDVEADDVEADDVEADDVEAIHTIGDNATPASVGQGWWAPQGGEARWFETFNYHFIDLAADITAVALRMQENRDVDGVPGATDILLLPFGSNYKLRMVWFDPATSEALGGDEYVIVLHDDGDESFDASDFEHTCRDAGQYAAEVEGYTGPRLHFRWEWGGDHWPLG
jgi:hypothetical protein